MAIYYVKDSNSKKLRQKENTLVWFDESQLKGCENALVLYGGDLILLKTTERISQSELSKLIGDDKKWAARFGKNFKSEQLRQAVQESYTVNSHK